MSIQGPGTLMIKPLAGKLKRDTEVFGSMDPYCKVKLGGQEQKTHTHNGGGKHPSWNDGLSFRRNGEHILNIEVWEKDAISKDDLIGETQIALQQVFENKKGQDWYTLSYKGKDAGQILVQYEWFPDNKPMPIQQTGQMPMYQQPVYPQQQTIPMQMPQYYPNQMPPQQQYYPPQQQFPQQQYPPQQYPPQQYQQPPMQQPYQQPPMQQPYQQPPMQQPYQQPPMNQPYQQPYPQQQIPQQYPPQQYPPQQYPPQQYPPQQYPPQGQYKPY